ncbi:2TM domain-containing protein [Methanopyrus kandleri]|uniref:Uncharacterized protein conserved in archaea n=2 Tax=Methanopyrus kandleri TaxID=2320 RepID=Q8TWB2_METKA|nr:2TM domain-containing protein [Methanopyrus kandleri]AAM02336.1 Uncharacterized protein conserved in archaea [Methanopyrus kandleri AV19]HII69757.1 2TM domain-containing protein [Methanopyrus kandleri]
MSSETSELDEYRETFRELYYEEALKGFRAHLTIYLIGCVAMVVMNLTLTPRVIWVIWPVLGWGAGVYCHYLGVRRAERNIRRLEEEALRRVQGP